MKITTAHKRFSDLLDNQSALEHPEEFLGPNWKDVLNFWFFLDTLTEEQMKIINDRYWALSYDERWLAIDVAEEVAANYSSCDAAWLAVVGSAIVDSYAASYATYELIGSHILKEQGKSLVFFPLFLNP